MKKWPILSILMSSLIALGLANAPAWSDEESPGRGPRWAPKPDEAVSQKAELESALRQLREKAAQTEALLRQLEEKAQRESTRRPPPVRQPIQLRQDKPMPVVIRFNHISAASFVRTLDQLARNPKVAEAFKEMPWAVNEEANAVVMIIPPEAAEILTTLARELDQPSQYHKAAPRHDLKFNLPAPPGSSGPGQPGGLPIPGTGITIPNPMQPGMSCPMQGMKSMPGACPMQSGAQCPMQAMKAMTGMQCPMQAMAGMKCPMQAMKAATGGQCPMQGMKAMPGGQPDQIKVIIDGVNIQPETFTRPLPGPMPMQPGGHCPMQGMKAAPGAAAPDPMRPGAQERSAPKIAEAMELLESVLKSQPNPRIAELVKALQAALKEQAGHRQVINREEIEKAEKHRDADKEKAHDKGRFRIMLKDDEEDDD